MLRPKVPLTCAARAAPSAVKQTLTPAPKLFVAAKIDVSALLEQQEKDKQRATELAAKYKQTAPTGLGAGAQTVLTELNNLQRAIEIREGNIQMCLRVQAS